MSRSFFNSIICIIAVMCLTVSIANAQTFTDGDIVHMEDAGTLTDANLVEISNTSSSTTLHLFFRVTIAGNIADNTKINATARVPTDKTAPIPTFSYKNGEQWTDLQTSTNDDTVSIAYNVIEGIATAQNATTVQVRATFTTVPAHRFQLELDTTTLDRVYFDCNPGPASRAVYDVTKDGKIDASDITAVAVAMQTNLLTGDVSEDGRINYVDFDLVTFAVRLGYSLPTPTPNRAPTTVNTIPDQTVTVGGTTTISDISPYFSDPDGDTLTYTASSSDTAKATVAVSNTTLTLTGVAVGTATITVTATDPDSLSVTQTFTVTVVQANRAPVKVGTIPDQTVDVGGTTTINDVSPYFSDPDDDALAYTATSSDTAKATVAVSGATLTLTGVAVGTATITVTATDPDSLSVTQTFTVTVAQPNRAPVAVGTIPDQTVNVGATTTISDISAYFNDPDGGPLTYTATSLDTAKATVALSNATLTLTGVAAGTATINVTATDPDSLTATQTFTVTVVQPNRAPVAVGTIPDQAVGATTVTVDVSSYFSDPDGDTLTYTATSSDTSKVTVSVSNSTVSITRTAITATGTATITVTATDPGGLSATQTFAANLGLVYSPPVAEGVIPNQTVNVGETATISDVSVYFNDPGGNTLTYTATSSDTAKATVAVSNATLTLTGVAAGTATITVTATNPGGLSATQTFTATVVQPNRAPVAVGTIPDQTVSIDDTNDAADAIDVTAGDVSNYFSDPDGDPLTYTVTSSDTTVVTVGIVTITIPSVDPTNTGRSTVTINLVAVGTVTITVTATDPGGLSATQTFTVTVVQSNGAPTTVGTIPDQTVYTAGTARTTTVDVSSYFSDPNNDTLTYSATSSDTSIATVSVSTATITITGVAAGTATITVTATDPGGLSATQTFTVTVVQSNRAPTTVGSISDLVMRVDDPAETIDVGSYFTDADGDALAYTATSSDTTIATVSMSSATVSITPVAVGTTTITVTATDPDGLSVNQTFSVTVVPVNQPPETVGTISDQTFIMNAETTPTFDVVSFFSDPEGQALTYTATSSDTTVATVTMSNTTIFFTLVAVGTTTITVTATDPGGLSATQTFTVTVVPPNSAPVAVGTIPDQTVYTAGTARTITVDVSSYFSDPNNDTLTYSATSSDTSIATVSVSTATVTITGVAAGTATITVTATDPGGLTATQTFTVTVVQPNRAPVAVGTIPDQTVNVGGTSSIATVDVSGYFSDPDGDTLTYTATSSDTTLATVSVSGATVTITGVAAGTATITVTATDPGGLSAIQTFTVTVVQPNRAPVAVGTMPNITAYVDGAGLATDITVFFSDPDGDTLTYTATSSDTTVATVGILGIRVTIDAVAAGTATATVTATDPGGLSANQTFTVTVVSDNLAPVITDTIPDVQIRNSGTYGVYGELYFSDPDGDTLTYTATTSDSTIAQVAVGGVENSTVTILANALGSVSITITVTDPGGLTATQTFTATVVNNFAPVITDTIPDVSVRNSATYGVYGELYFSDPDGDTLTYTATSSNSTIAEVAVGGVENSTVTILANALGAATITITVTDPSGATASQTFTATVVNNFAPVITDTIPDVQIRNSLTYGVYGELYFSDPDGDTLTYTATSSNNIIAQVAVGGVENSTVTILANALGAVSITITVTDPSGATASQTFTAIVVSETGDPSPIGTIPNQTLYLGEAPATVDVSGYFLDPNGDVLTYTATSFDITKATVSVSSSTLTITPIAVGTTAITVTATDPGGLTATQTFGVTVVQPNRAPVVTQSLPDMEAILTSTPTVFTITTSAFFSDADGDPLTYTATSSDPTIATVSWTETTQTITKLAVGTVTITVTATDPGGLSASQTYSLAVWQPNRAPVTVGTIPDQTVDVVGTAPTVDLSTYFSDPDGDTLVYQARSSDTSIVTVSWSNSTTITITGVAAGTATITAQALDPSYRSATQTINVTVSNSADVNNDGVVNIFDLVLVASQIGTTNATADVNGDGTVNTQDLVLVSSALSGTSAAPAAKQSAAAVVNNWLKLARENASTLAATSIPEGFSYQRGIAMLEQLARALTPNKTALLANYPNPFNPETWIPYQLSKAADVTVTIYASDGNVVRTLAIGHRDVGMYKTRSQAAYWDGTNEMGESVASGVYFYTLTAGDFSATRKMLILK